MPSVLGALISVAIPYAFPYISAFEPMIQLRGIGLTLLFASVTGVITGGFMARLADGSEMGSDTHYWEVADDFGKVNEMDALDLYRLHAAISSRHASSDQGGDEPGAVQQVPAVAVNRGPEETEKQAVVVEAGVMKKDDPTSYASKLPQVALSYPDPSGATPFVLPPSAQLPSPLPTSSPSKPFQAEPPHPDPSGANRPTLPPSVRLPSPSPMISPAPAKAPPAASNAGGAMQRADGRAAGAGVGDGHTSSPRNSSSLRQTSMCAHAPASEQSPLGSPSCVKVASPLGPPSCVKAPSPLGSPSCVKAASPLGSPSCVKAAPPTLTVPRTPVTRRPIESSPRSVEGPPGSALARYKLVAAGERRSGEHSARGNEHSLWHSC